MSSLCFFRTTPAQLFVHSAGFPSSAPSRIGAPSIEVTVSAPCCPTPAQACIPTSTPSRIGSPPDTSVEALRECNACLPVARLPPELVGNIFMQYRDSLSPTDLSWIVITQVHHAWRVMAISYASLWSTVDLCRPRLAEVFIHRASSAGLHLDTKFCSGLNQTIDSRILNLMREGEHEIRGVRILATIGDISTNTILDIAKKSASTLRSLVVRIPETPYDVVRWCFPVLHTLHLLWTIPQWTSPIFRSARLRVLRVSAGSFAPSLPYSLHHILDTLEFIPQLAELHLFKCLPRISTHTASTWQRTIRLPSLKVLELHDDTNACSALVANIIRPLRCRTHVYCHDVLSDHRPRRHHLLAHTMNPAPCVYGIRFGRESIQLFSGAPNEDARPFRLVSLTYSMSWRNEVRIDLERIGAALAAANASTIVLIPEAPEKAHWKGLTSSGRADTLHVDWSRLDLRLVSRARWDDSNPQARYLHGLADALGRGFLPELRTLVMKGLDRLIARPEPDNARYPLDVLWGLGEVLGVLAERIERGSAFNKLLFVDAEGVPKDTVETWAATIPIVQFVDSADNIFSRLIEHWTEVSSLQQ